MGANGIKCRVPERDSSKRMATMMEERSVQSPDQGGGVQANRRGRKAMGSEERLEVSERMKRYWANRRERRKQVKE